MIVSCQVERQPRLDFQQEREAICSIEERLYLQPTRDKTSSTEKRGRALVEGEKKSLYSRPILTLFCLLGCGFVIGTRGLKNETINVPLEGRLRQRKHHGFSFYSRRSTVNDVQLFPLSPKAPRPSSIDGRVRHGRVDIKLSDQNTFTIPSSEFKRH